MVRGSSNQDDPALLDQARMMSPRYWTQQRLHNMQRPRDYQFGIMDAKKKNPEKLMNNIKIRQILASDNLSFAHIVDAEEHQESSTE